MAFICLLLHGCILCFLFLQPFVEIFLFWAQACLASSSLVCSCLICFCLLGLLSYLIIYSCITYGFFDSGCWPFKCTYVVFIGLSSVARCMSLASLLVLFPSILCDSWWRMFLVCPFCDGFSSCDCSFLAHWWSMAPSLIVMPPPYLFWVISICCRREWLFGWLWLILSIHNALFYLEKWNNIGANGHQIWLRGKTQWEKVPWLVVLIEYVQMLELSWESLVSTLIVHGYAR